MKKKYILSLVVIGLMLALTLTIGTGYGLWVSTRDKNELSSTTLGCFQIYYQEDKGIDKDIIEMKNIEPLTVEEGLETSPYTLTIKNTCNVDKELQVRLNVLKDTSVDLKALTLEATGYISQDTSLYNNLQLTKSEMPDVVQSRLIGIVNVKPDEIVRTNVKLWFDERKTPKIDKSKILKAQFEFIDSESSVKAKFYELLLTDKVKIEAKKAPNFANQSTGADGLYVTNSDTGKTYYYRGVVNNNYVSFGNFLWRIIRINEDGTIRLIANKSVAYTNFNDLRSRQKDFAGYSYLWYRNAANSIAKDTLENWYNTNITAKSLDKYLTASNYCNDTGYQTTNYHTYFNGYKRLSTDNAPSLICPTTNADFGGVYNAKVGLITADEVVLAGGAYNKNNMNYYLYNEESFYTLTPYDFYQGTPTLYAVDNTGTLTTSPVNKELGLRPVITLKSDITVTGSGTIDNPYIIDME